MLLSIWLPQQLSSSADPGRIAAQVVSGMGFLGAGAIIRLGNNIRGLTTAASLWLVAAIGMAIGAGMYVAALVAEVLSLIALMALNPVERKIFPVIKSKLLEVQYNHSAEPDTDAAMEVLKNFGIESQSLSVRLGHAKGEKTRVRFLVGIPETIDISKLAKALKSSGDIARIQIKESI
jgi:putative Mg2+ transporter-C (MgtC) family protein